ncbi:MAG: ATP-binding cassette domain-containing protein, partial [Nitrospinota bacterium]|nr:ATP-binding cassette domain-containing protein [Nitrospinota bacterium]
MADERLLDIQGVSKRFGGFDALTEVSVHVNAGERFGLIGPNGSGKTTLINCVSGTLPCDGGRVVFDGSDITATPSYKRARMGLVRSFQIPKPFISMTVLENLCIPLEYAAHYKSHHGLHIRTEAEEILQLVGLDGEADAKPGGLTQIEMRKLELARALAARPKLLILDEATEGLAPLVRAEIWRCLQNLKSAGQSILVIDKGVDALTRIGDRHYIIERGGVVWKGDSHELR